MSVTTPPASPQVRLAPDEVAELNRRFDKADPAAILRWSAGAVPAGRLVVSSTFGVGGMVIIHLLSDAGIRLPVVFVDTLYHFPETIEHAYRVRDRYDLDLRIYRAAPTRKEFEAVHGRRLWERDEELFHQLTKVDPMRRALEDVDGWITGRRRDQSSTRAALPVVEIVGERVKVNPVASWSLDVIWGFIRASKIPYNPLHDLGYASIGDVPLTTPIRPGEQERDGRWRESSRLECGLHGI
jgi:phosphoadenosine phosphosulfate reductase